MQIDSHQHFWVFDPDRDSWITPDMAVIQRNFLPQDLKPVLETNGIGGCVAVQASQSDAETEFLLHLAAGHEIVKGVVGWVDLVDQDIYQKLEKYSQLEDLKGFRHVVQGEPDGFMLNPAFINGVNALVAFDFSYDILVFPHQLKEAYQFASKIPRARFVLDHIAKPYIKKGEIENWATDIKQLATLPNVHCKVSGMVTEADWAQWKPNDFMPYLEVVFNAFGADRILFGSDWPVCLVAADYAQMMEIPVNYIKSLSKSEQEKVMGKNATSFYHLDL